MLQRKILILYAHPNPLSSRVHRRLRAAIQDIVGVEVRDLYQRYPHFLIATHAEQEALLGADLIVFQHPIYWYSAPALLKEWMDRVLESGFAFGQGGDKLHGKDFMQIVSTGGAADAYQSEGLHKFSLEQLLSPFVATAKLCGLRYHRPFAVHGVGTYSDKELEQEGQRLRRLLLNYLAEGPGVLKALGQE